MHWRFENKKYKYLNLVLNNIKAYKLLIYFIYYKKYCPCLYLMYQSVAQSQKSAIKNLCPFPAIARPRFIGSTPKSVDFNERRRIGQEPSIDNFQSFYSRRLGVVLASSCGGSPR